ncbi:hypothetical protein BP00DRAFT_74446 [Aspergillus indologenus CBS 114.80]|uniref:Uncharacterized protein n=1 Tax=Aspergillus indologenus CBS 114.80 TaxID=1450541 RepID=A0A2V5IJI1_9EURO|nr:hypothetical protein BP00DRAFT_74446 [Aspergillus indologenus CBS 114.80]
MLAFHACFSCLLGLAVFAYLLTLGYLLLPACLLPFSNLRACTCTCACSYSCSLVLVPNSTGFA